MVHGRILLPRFLPSPLQKLPNLSKRYASCYSANTAPMKSINGSLESSRAALSTEMGFEADKDSLLGNTLKKIQEK